MRIVVRGRVDARLSDSFASAVFGEFRELLGFAGLTRWRIYSTTVNLFVILAFGIVVPWRRGIEFFDPLLLLLYSFIALLFAAPAITELLGRQWTNAQAVLARVFASALFGWGAFCLILLLGIVAVQLEYRAGRMLFPAPNVLGAALGLSLTASCAVSAVGALFSVVLDPLSAKLILRGAFVGILLLLLFGGRFLPPAWQASLAQNITPRAVTQSAYIVSGILALLAAGPVIALSFTRSRNASGA
jgi:hypothetical protein